MNTETTSISSAYVLAQLPIRLAARAVDVSIVAAADIGLGRVMGFGFGWLGVGTALVLAYFAGSDAVFGMTVGKLLTGLRVIGPSGDKPTLRQALVREAFTILGSVPFVGVLLALGAWVWIIRTIRSSPLRQGRHDILAGGTRVVRVVATSEIERVHA